MTRRRTAFLLLFLAAPLGAAVDPGAGVPGAALLRARPGVRAEGMGQAFTAVADGADGFFYNPAGLGFDRNVEAAASHRTLTEGGSENFFSLNVPLAEASAESVPRFGSLGVGSLLVDNGTFTGRDASGNPAPDFTAQDTLYTLAYGQPIGPLSLGVSGTMFHSRLAEATSNATDWDAGLLYRRSARLSLGLAVRHMGGGVSFDNAPSARSPRTVSCGASFTPVSSLTFSVDAERVSGQNMSLRGGGEWRAAPLLALRAGYDGGDASVRGLTLGLSLIIEKFEFGFYPLQRFSLDYAFTSSAGFGDRHDVALRLRFGD